MKTNILITLLTILLIIITKPISMMAQYYPGTVGITTIASSQSALTDLNCDVRNFNYSNMGCTGCSPMYAVAYDGTSPGIYWHWTDGSTSSTYFGTISLPSGAYGADVVILYNNQLVSEPYIAVVYGLAGGGGNPIATVVFKLYQFNPASPSFSLYYTKTYSCSSSWFPRIDADSRGYFAFAWENSNNLHTVAGKLSGSNPYYSLGQEKMLNIPNMANCSSIYYPDVALYGKNQTNSDNRIYYTYIRCGLFEVITEQTQTFSSIFTGGGVPAVYSSYDYTAPGNGFFLLPRIAANMYNSSGGGNDAQEDEFTVVCTMGDLNSNETSIFAMTAMWDTGCACTRYSEYNVTSDNFTGSGQAAFENVNSYTPPENIDVSGSPISSNYSPVVAYDIDNTHVVICWTMEYGDSPHSAVFPTGTFPAHVYANPIYNKNSVTAPTNYPSMQPLITGTYTGCEINGLDNTAKGANSNSTSLVAVACHNTNDLLYAWWDGNTGGSGDINVKIVTSGSTPRMGDNNINFNNHLVYPNPVNREQGVIHLNLKNDQKYTISLYNMIGESLLQVTGYSQELENELSSSLKKCNAGLYQLNLLNEKQEKENTKILIN